MIYTFRIIIIIVSKVLFSGKLLTINLFGQFSMSMATSSSNLVQKDVVMVKCHFQRGSHSWTGLMGCLLLMKATIELIFITKMANLEIIFWSNAMAFYLHKAFGSDRTHRRYRRFYPIITIHISLFATNLSEYDISFFTMSHHSCNKWDYSWVRRSSTEIIPLATAWNWLHMLDNW